MLENQTIERTTLSQLVCNEEYTRKVLPFLKGEYFSDKIERTIFEEIQTFVEKYKLAESQTPNKTFINFDILNTFNYINKIFN